MPEDRIEALRGFVLFKSRRVEWKRQASGEAVLAYEWENMESPNFSRFEMRLRPTEVAGAFIAPEGVAVVVYLTVDGVEQWRELANHELKVSF
jgi:hypothetical protein